MTTGDEARGTSARGNIETEARLLVGMTRSLVATTQKHF